MFIVLGRTDFAVFLSDYHEYMCSHIINNNTHISTSFQLRKRDLLYPQIEASP